MPPHSSTHTTLARSSPPPQRQGRSRHPAESPAYSKSPSSSPSRTRARNGSPKSSPKNSPKPIRAQLGRVLPPPLPPRDGSASPSRAKSPAPPLPPRIGAGAHRLNVVMSPPAIRKLVMVEITNRKTVDPSESPVITRRAHSPAPLATPSINHAAPISSRVAPSPLKLSSPAIFSPHISSPMRSDATTPRTFCSPALLSPTPLRPGPGDKTPVSVLKASHGVPISSSTRTDPTTPLTPCSPALLSPTAPRAGDKTPVGVLKSSHGVSKSPMMRDYLINALSAKSDSAPDSPASPSTITRSRSPSYPLASPSGSPKTRKLSEPIPVFYDHLSRRTELTGSSDTITMPYNVTHTAHIDSSTLGLLVQGNNLDLLSSCNIPIYEKSGVLHKLTRSTWKERWFVCKNSVLTYYKKKESKKHHGQVYLTDCECSRDRNSKRPHTLRLLHLPTKKTYQLSACSAEVFDEWVRVLLGAGAIDKDLLLMEHDQKDREKKEAAARAAKELKKKEDEYVKKKMTKRSTLKLTNKNMLVTEMEACKCEISVKEREKEGETEEVFRIEILFDDQQWTIFRNYDKIVKLYEASTKLKFVKGMCPPRKAPSSLSESEFREVQRESVQKLFDALARNRACVFANSSSKRAFLRFIAPVGWHDIKADKFVMPFQFDF